jgi:hypothetical protein
VSLDSSNDALDTSTPCERAELAPELRPRERPGEVIALRVEQPERFSAPSFLTATRLTR